ncbi:MAG: MmcQ/YjbR family DNA-binding protein [Bacteroidia bacterium]|jgi:predicted DNA-binding protein (MmcQ/YjbR family)
MHIEAFREYCLRKKGVEETFPFDNDTLVFKVMGKMFSLISLKEPDTCNLKCDPAYALELRARYDSITPGFHMNKQHWNTVALNADIPPKLISELIDHSYDCVVKKLTRAQQATLKNK